MNVTEYALCRQTKVYKGVAIILVFVLIASLIPIIIASFYAHPVLDDYGYSYKVHEALNHGEGFNGVLKSASQEVIETYFSWQGTFAAVFFFSLQPGAFSQGLYCITTFFILSLLLFSNFFLLYTIIVKGFNSKKVYWIIVASTLSFLQIQFLPDIKEGLFWYNGSSYYIGFYAFSLIFFALVIRLLLTEKKLEVIIVTVFSVIFAVLIGGGNYTTALITTIIIITISIYAIRTKQKNSYLLLVITGVLIFALFVSILAPGNKVRANSTSGQNPLIAIVKSFCYAVVYIGRWTRLPEIMFFVISLPVLFILSKKTKFSFKYPLLAIVFIFCVFSAQFTPSLYALSKIGGGRQINIYYFGYYWMALGQMFYVCGWLNNNLLREYVEKRRSTKYAKYTSFVLIIAFLLMSIGCIGQVKSMSSAQAFYSVCTGASEEFDNQFERIVAELQIPGEICFIDDSKLQSNIYHGLNLSNNERDSWTNAQLAEYYHHEKVIKKE